MGEELRREQSLLQLCPSCLQLSGLGGSPMAPLLLPTQDCSLFGMVTCARSCWRERCPHS